MAQMSNDACIAEEPGSGPDQVEPKSPRLDSPEPDADVYSTQKCCYKIPFMNGKGPASKVACNLPALPQKLISSYK